MIAIVKRILFLLTIVIIAPAALTAKIVPISAELDSTNLLMGTTTRLSFKIEKPDEGVKIKFPLFDNSKDRPFIGLLNDTIELSSLKVDTTLDNGKRFINYSMTVQAFDSGSYKLPPFELIIGRDTARTNALTMNVIPVRVKADDQIDPFSDVLEPFEVTMADGENKDKSFWDLLLEYWWLDLLILLFIAILIYGIIRYRKTGSVLPVKKPLPPYEAALLAMNNLREKQLWQNGKEKEYYTSLTDILRVYLQKQYDINAKEMTSRQIMKALKKNQKLRPSRELVRPVLELADFVKFAKQKPVEDENTMVFDHIMQFLHQTKPVVEETAPKKGGLR